MMTDTKYRYFIRQYKNRIFTYSMYMLKNRMDAEDVVQEAFIRIWKNIDNVGFVSAQAWIMKTTHNLCIDTLRKRGIAIKRESAIDECFEETYADNKKDNDPAAMFQRNIMDKEIKNAITRLPETLKSVFVLYEIQELSCKEISRTLDIKLSSVRVYLMRARKKLQEELMKKSINGVIDYEG